MMIVCLDAILDVGEAERSANLIETAAAHAVLRLGTMRSNLSLPPSILSQTEIPNDITSGKQPRKRGRKGARGQEKSATVQLSCCSAVWRRVVESKCRSPVSPLPVSHPRP